MMRSLLLSVVLLALGMSACSDDAATVSDDERCEDLGTCVDSARATVCGESGLGFLFHSTGGSFLSLFQAELGHRYVAVDPSCRFSVFQMVGSGIGTAFEGTLTPAQAREVDELLQLDQWEAADSQGGHCAVPDAGSLRLAWGEQSTFVSGACGGQPDELWPTLGLTLEALPDLLRSFGDPADGPIRYALTELDPRDTPDEASDTAPRWPLAIPASVAAMRIEGDDLVGYADVRVGVATDQEAAALRALRASVLDTARFPEAIPIRDDDGSHYRLELRDVVQFETADGLPLVPWNPSASDQD
ncbi:MAG: hypothetical protein WBG86_17130 [Polyangiales bacterium]